MWKERNTLALLVEIKNGAATLENSMEVPQKVQNKTIYNPATALLGIYPKNTKILIQRDTQCLQQHYLQ